MSLFLEFGKRDGIENVNVMKRCNAEAGNSVPRSDVSSTKVKKDRKKSQNSGGLATAAVVFWSILNGG